METIEALTTKHETAARHLADAVEKTYPIGAIVRTRISGADPGVWIEAEVIGHGWGLSDPHQLRLRNTVTGKTRRVSAHPRYGRGVQLIRLPENAQAMASADENLTQRQETL